MSTYQETNFDFTGSLVIIIGPMLATAALFVLLPLMFSVVHTPPEPNKKTLEITMPLRVIKKAPVETERTQEEARPKDIQRQQQIKKTTETPAMEPLPEGIVENSQWTVPIVANKDFIKNTEFEFTVTPSFDPNVFTIDEVDREPIILRRVMPQYPPYAERNNIEGNVVLRFIVDTNGNVVEPVVTESEPKGVFDDAAIEAILKCRFRPAEKHGKPVDCIVVAPMTFQLR